MARSKTRVVVHRAALRSMFVRGGGVYEFAGDVQSTIHKSARRLAPKRSGTLARSIRSSPIGNNGYGCNFQVTATAPYVRFVTEGTVGPIFGHHGPMRLYADGRRGVPARYRGSVGQRKWWVEGQAPNPFLEEGLRIGLARHGLW